MKSEQRQPFCVTLESDQPLELSDHPPVKREDPPTVLLRTQANDSQIQ